MEHVKMHQLRLLSTIHRETLVGLTHQTCKDQANTNTDGESPFQTLSSVKGRRRYQMDFAT